MQTSFTPEQWMEGPILEAPWPSVLYHITLKKISNKNLPNRQGYLPPPLLEDYILAKLQIPKIGFVTRKFQNTKGGSDRYPHQGNKNG